MVSAPRPPRMGQAGAAAAALRDWEKTGAGVERTVS